MIAISSFRPLDENAEYAENQRRARASWLKVFDGIEYFNKVDLRMRADAGPAVIFFGKSDAPPTIKEMMEHAAAIGDWSCIANADIVVKSKFYEVEHRLRDVGAKCAISRRFNFDPKNMKEPAKATDLGLDIFCAVPEVWQRAAQEIPEGYALGRGAWDTWTLGFFMSHWPNDCYDFSRSAVIFHPIHGNRGDQSCAVQPDRYVNGVAWPMKFIEL